MQEKEGALTDGQLRQLLRMIQAGKSDDEIRDGLVRPERGRRVVLDSETIRGYKRACEIHCQLCIGELRKDLGIAEGSPVLDWILRRLRETRNDDRDAECGVSPEREAHWRELATLAEQLLLAIRISAPPGLWLLECCPHIAEDADGLDALSMLLCGKAIEAEKSLYSQLLAHMDGEFPEWKAKMGILREAAVSYCKTLHSVACNVVEEAEKRTGFPYDPAFRYGLGCDFGATVCETAASWKRQRLEYSREGLDLRYGSYGLARVGPGQEESLKKVQEVHEAMIKEVKCWPDLRKALEIHGQIQQASTSLKQALAQVVEWGAFTNSKCPGCP